MGKRCKPAARITVLGDLPNVRRRLPYRPPVVYRWSIPGRRWGVTEDEIRDLAAAWAERTATEQGLPPRVMDISVLRQVVYLLELRPREPGTR
jgi:hypothetical protein